MRSLTQQANRLFQLQGLNEGVSLLERLSCPHLMFRMETPIQIRHGVTVEIWKERLTQRW